MATPFEAHGTLGAAGDTVVDNNTSNRWSRVRAYNADTVNHTITWKKGTTPLKKTVLLPGQDDEYGPVYCPNGTTLTINNAEGTTTTAPTYETNGEF